MPKGFVWALMLAAVGGAVAAADPAELPAAGRLVKKAYPVADLVYPMPAPAATLPPLGRFRVVSSPDCCAATATPPAPQPGVVPAGATTCTAAACPTEAARQLPPQVRKNADSLVRLIATMVRPYSWAGMGGPGTVEFRPDGSALVVTQTPDVQAQVAELLTALRRLQEKTTPQVSMELRVLEVPDALFQQVGSDLGLVCKAGDERTAACLSDKQVAALMEAARADRGANVLAVPKVTCLDMQQGLVQIGGSQVFQTGLELTAGPDGVVKKPRYEAVDVGMRIAVTPQVSADRRQVLVDLRYESAGVSQATPPTPVAVGTTEPGGPAPDVLTRPAVNTQSVRMNALVPDGGTVVVAGPAVARTERTEVGQPVLSNVPLVNRMFRNVATVRESRRQMLVLTARVLPPEPEDRPAAGCPACAAAKSAAGLVSKAECAKCCAESGETAKLVGAYRKACAEGRTEEAMKLAMQALARDPKCFAAEK